MTNDLTGKVIRGYHITDVIGSGGFGVVYKAHQPIIERDVAIKVIHTKYANQLDFTRRFELEARLIARLESQYIVPVYDFWRDSTGAYLVMRWLRGDNLRTALMRPTPLPIPFVVKVLFQLVSALDVAHQHNVVHRDIKPENVLFDEQQNVYLTDFGIAVDILHTPTEVTMKALSLGSPVYMAPEQLARYTTSPQADVYSLGVLLYEMLAGKMPFTGDVTEIIKLKREAFPLPSILQTRKDLPPAIDGILWQATAYSPNARYESVIDFFNAFIKMLSVQMDFSVLNLFTTPESASQPPNPFASSNNTLPLNGGTQILDDTPSKKIQVKRSKGSTTQHIEPLIRNPFKGLRPFDEIDARDFFGRAEAIKRLCDFFAEGHNRFLAVLGPSGSGKSSLVRAGLLATVRQQALPNSRNWMMSVMTPSDDPFRALSEALAEVTIITPPSDLPTLRQSADTLHDHLCAILPDGIDLFLLIDQFEEVFTQSSDEQIAPTFLSLLHHAITHPQSRLRLVITLRADYYDRPLQHPQFGGLVREHTEVVLPLSDLAFEEIIIEPALQVGLTVAPDLKQAILSDLAGQQGALPLLQYTLSELYENRGGGNRLSLEVYHKLGGISGALSGRAETIYQDMTADEQRIAQQLFLRCVAVAGGGIPTRRRVLMTDLLLHLPTNHRKTVTDVVEKFARWRLLTLDRDPITRSPTIDIAHEALIRAWSRLNGWIEDNRADLRRYYQLQMLTQAWLEAGKDPSFLAVGARLTEFETILNTTFITLSDDETTFIASSTALKRRRSQWARLGVIGLIIFSIIAGILAIFALTQQQIALSAQAEALLERDRANTTAQIARSRELAANSVSSLGQLDVALLLAYYASTTADTYEARNSLLSALQYNPNLIGYAHGHEGAVRAVVYRADATQALSAGTDKIIRVWNVADWSLQMSIPTDHTDTITALAIIDDTVITAGADGLMMSWSIRTGEKIITFATQNSPVWDMVINRDGTRLASGTDDGTLTVWDVQTGDVIHRISNAHAGAIYALAFSPDGKQLASGGGDNLIRVWDVETGELSATLTGEHTNWVTALAYAPTGEKLVSGGADSRLVFWDTTTYIPTQTEVITDALWIRGLTYNATGEMVALVGLDGGLRVWDAVSGMLFSTPSIAHQSGIWDVDASSSDAQFITAGEDGQVILWDFSPPYRPATRALINPGQAMSMTQNPTQPRLAVGLSNGAVMVWDIETALPQTRLREHQTAVIASAYSPTGAYLATFDLEQTVLVWDMTTESVLHRVTIREAVITPNIAFSADESAIFIAGDSVLLRLSLTDETITSIPIENLPISAFEISPDGNRMAVGGNSGAIVLIHLADMTQTRLSGHADAVTALAFAPNRGVLVSASRDNTLMVWDMQTGEAVYEPLRAHTDWVLDVTIAPDERMMASSGRDQTVILWDLTTARPLGTPFTGHRDWVGTVIFSTDGTRLYSAGQDGVVFEWMVAVADWQKSACQISNRAFREDEWARYFEVAPADCGG